MPAVHFIVAPMYFPTTINYLQRLPHELPLGIA